MKRVFQKPKIIKNESTLKKFLKNRGDLVFVDIYLKAIKELFYIENPKYRPQDQKAKQLLEQYVNNQRKLKPEWIYLPWSNTLIKTVPEEIYFKLRTARNRDIITQTQQQKYRDFRVGIAGLSVGSKIISTLIQSGGPKYIRIADFDTIDITNLNRIEAKISDIGSPKTLVAARNIYDLDPYAKVELWERGLNIINLEKFICNKPAIDVLIDEMDDIALKIKCRLIARSRKIPIVMATDNGDSLVLDIERYDLEPNRKLFHGLIDKIEDQDFSKMDYKEWLSLATKIVNPSYLPISMRDSILKIGKTINAVPQLGATASMAGSAIAYVLRKMANKEKVLSGRYIVNLEKQISLDYNSLQNKKARQKNLKFFLKNF